MTMTNTATSNPDDKVNKGDKVDYLDFLPTKEAFDQVRRFCKSLRRINRRKFELKQKNIHLRGGSGCLLDVHLKK